MIIKSTEKGQALVMIAIAAVVLFGFAALAIDGSMAFSVRKQSANAADAAALAAALAKTRGNDWHAAAMTSALANKFNDDTTTNEVDVYSCDEIGIVCPGLSATAIKSQYIMVVITTHMNTSLTRVLGRDQITQIVSAVARAVPGYVDEIAYGNAVVALKPDGCGVFRGHGGPNNHFETQGGGIFVNTQDNCGFTIQGNTVPITPSITIAGANQLPYPPITLPNPSCGSMNATQTGTTLSPGHFSGAFPPSNVTHLDGGVYCINGNFSLNGNDTLKGAEVVIVMESGDITFNGNGKLEISAPTVGPFEGLLIYVPMGNTSTIKINGTNDQKLTGTILAPSSDIVLLGDAGTQGFNSQIIGYTVEYGGNFNGTIRYTDAQNFNAAVPPTIELAK